MLLVDLTFNNNHYYISNEYIDREGQFYDGVIVSCTDINYTMSTIYGGYISPRFGSITILSNFFKDSGMWPPPEKMNIKMYYAVDKNASKTLILEGILHITSIEQIQVNYTIYQTGNTIKQTDEVFYDYLLHLFSDAANDMGLSFVDVSNGSRNPLVDYTAHGARNYIDNLNDIAKFYSHSFWINNNTLNLCDNNAVAYTTTQKITEFDILPSTYRYAQPISILKTIKDDTDHTEISVAGTYEYGNTITVTPSCTPNEGVMKSTLGNIKAIIDKPQITFKMPLTKIYNLGDRLQLYDYSNYKRMIITMYVRNMIINFDNDEIIVSGEGTIIG